MIDGDATTQAEAVDLGGLTLEPELGWRFYPMADRLAGRPMSGVGVAQFMRLTDGAPPAATATHEVCMAAAVAASGFDVHGPGADRALERGGPSCLAGGESFPGGDDFVRVWYHCCADGFVAAWFACPAHRAAERSVRDLIRDCDRMVASVRLPTPLA